MRLHRFYVLQPLGEEVVIDDVSLVSQWTKVFRYKEGDLVILFNGDGYDYHCSLVEISKKACSLTRTKSVPSYIPTKKISLYLSIIKKDNFELATQKATELGVTRIVPILSERSEKKNISLERLQKIATEASEQCGRGDVPQISPITPLDEAISSLTTGTTGVVCSLGDIGLANFLKENKTDNIALFVGPEGGWGAFDEALFERSTLNNYSLGKTVLRAETAAITACALVSFL